MKSILLALIGLSLVNHSQASIGGTKSEALKEYGVQGIMVPSMPNASLYQMNPEWNVVEYYNEIGVCYLVGYYKLSGAGLTPEDFRSTLNRSGLSQYANHWKIIPTTIGTDRPFWISDDGKYMSGSDHTVKWEGKLVYGLVYATAEDALKLVARGKP